MENNYLGREDAPIGSETWKVLDSTMAEAAKSVLTGRRLLHIEGPYGFGLKAVPTQDSPAEGGLISSGFVPVNLLYKTFLLSKRDIAAAERDGLPLNTAPIASVAIDIARQEDTLIFNGAPGAQGLLKATGAGSYKPGPWETVGKAAEDVIAAVTQLDKAGFHGPYTMALAPGLYNQLLRRYPQGGTELEHIQSIVTDGVFKAPILDRGGVLLASGKQYATIVLGQDMTVGFIGPVGENLEFSISESMALLIREPKAIVALK
jgi:uncharacterized linocin/CFP29 family protein